MYICNKFLCVVVFLMALNGFLFSLIKLLFEGQYLYNPLNSVQTLQRIELSGHELTRTQSQLCTATPISWFFHHHISFQKFSGGNHISVAESADTNVSEFKSISK